MKLQVFEHCTPSRSFPTRPQTCCSVTIIMLLALLLTASSRTLIAQENFLVATQDGTFSLYDLATTSLLETFQSSPLIYTLAAGPNPRLAYSAGGGGYGLAIDASIGRDIARLKGVRAPASTISSDGKYYLAADYTFVLDVVDTATLQVVQTVDFSSVIPRIGNPGAIVAANNQAYIFPRSQNPQSTKVAVINLSNFQLSSIPLPPGTLCRRCASQTPDGSLVVAIEHETSDQRTHVLLISTTTNTIVHDFQQSPNLGANAFVVTRSTDPNNLYGYAAVSGGNVLAVDLRPNSQTYGQFLVSTSVTLPNLGVSDLAISSDGSRLVVSGDPSVQPPAPNVDVIDTAKMLSDPTHALLAQLTVNGGIDAITVCSGFFPTTPPPTAPTVTGVSGDIINNQDNVVTVTGTNFQAGALVRIGSQAPFVSNFLGSTMLSVTVPKGAPAGKAQDIIVTNPLSNDPPAQQNQSGLLAGKFNILPDPRFQPTTQFGTGNGAFPYIYDLNQQTMVAITNSNPGDLAYGMVFNVDGKELYQVKSGFSGYYVLPINLTTNTPGSPILLPSGAYASGALQPLVAALDPQKDTPVIYASWTDTDLHLSKIDSNPSSPTFNTIIQTFDAGLSSSPSLEAITASPDGKFAYGWYNDGNNSLGIFNLSTGAFTSVSGNALGINNNQSEAQVYVTPDGKSLLLANSKANRTRIRVFDISNPISPKAIAEITPIPIPRRGFPYVVNYQVIGNKLYAIDLNGAAVVFNFDRTKGDFRERGYVASNSTQGYSAFAFSADGSYLYLADFYNDLVLVGDTSKLETNSDLKVTNIRSPYTPYLLAVSPVPPPMKAATAKHSGGGQQRSVEAQRINGAGVESH